MVFLGVLVLGLASLALLQIDLLPDITYPSITVFTEYKGAGPLEVESLVTIPVEESVATINGVKEVRSTSREDSSSVVVDFNWGKDLTEAANEVRERVARARDFLPEESKEPVVFKFDTSSSPILYLSLAGRMDPLRLYYLAKKQVKYQLEQVDGVARVDIWGGEEREIQVIVNRRRLEGVGLSLNQLVEILSRENLNRPAGHLETRARDFLVRPLGEFKQIAEIEQLVLSQRDGTPVYLRDAARVNDTIKEEREKTRVNGRPGIILAIRKQSGENTLDVSSRVQQRLARLQKVLPSQIQLRTFFDTSDFIRQAVSQVRKAVVAGGLLAVLVLFLFLRNLAGTFSIFLAIPLAILATFFLMNLGNITLNLMSLGGLALGAGMMVDSSIVVLENIYRHRQLGAEPMQAAVEGSGEVSMAITASTLTTLVVFLPLLFVQGVAGILFKELALTVSFSLLASLFVALTLVPVLGARLSSSTSSIPSSSSSQEIKGERPEDKDRKSILSALSLAFSGGNVVPGGGGIQGPRKRYGRALGWALERRGVVVAGSFLLLIGCLFLYPLIGRDLMPPMDEGSINGSLRLPTGTLLEVTDRLSRQIEEAVLEEVPEIQGMFARMGIGWMGRGGTHSGFYRIRLHDRSWRERSTREVVTKVLQPRLAAIAGSKIRIMEGGSVLGHVVGRGRQERLEVDIRGHDLKEGTRLALEVIRRIEGLPGTTYVRLIQEEGKPELQVRIDREKAAALGLNVSQILNTVQTAIQGTVATRFREGGEEYDVRVRLREEDRRAPSDLGEISFTAPSGARISLKNVARIERDIGPLEIERRSQERVLTVSATVQGRDLGSVVEEVRKRLQGLEVPWGFSVRPAGEQEEMEESFRGLQYAMALAVLLVYMVMASQFESLLDPLVILFAIPLSAIGVVLTLLVTHTTLSVPVYIGIILLVGVMVNNSIVLLDYIKLLRRRGHPLKESILLGASTRLRPILMTTLTTLVGLSPLALGLGEGSEMEAPLARVVMGGLVVSALFTLFFIPCLYSLFAREKRAEKSSLSSVS